MIPFLRFDEGTFRETYFSFELTRRFYYVFQEFIIKKFFFRIGSINNTVRMITPALFVKLRRRRRGKRGLFARYRSRSNFIRKSIALFGLGLRKHIFRNCRSLTGSIVYEFGSLLYKRKSESYAFEFSKDYKQKYWTVIKDGLIKFEEDKKKKREKRREVEREINGLKIKLI